MPEGWASLRRARRSASTAFTDSGSERSSANDARATTSRGPMFDRLYSNPSSLRPAPVGPRRGADVHPLQHPAQLASVRVRVHAHGAADRARDVDAELEPGQAQRGSPRGRLRQAGAAAADQAVLFVRLSVPRLRPASRQVPRIPSPLRGGSIPSPRLLRRAATRPPTAAGSPALRDVLRARRTRPRDRRCGSWSAGRADSRARAPAEVAGARHAGSRSRPRRSPASVVDVARSERQHEVALARRCRASDALAPRGGSAATTPGGRGRCRRRRRRPACRSRRRARPRARSRAG